MVNCFLAQSERFLQHDIADPNKSEMENNR